MVAGKLRKPSRATEWQEYCNLAADKVAAELKAKNIPVILGRTMSLPDYEDDPYDKPYTKPAELCKAGVKFAMGVDGAGSVFVSKEMPFTTNRTRELAWFVKAGMTPLQALATAPAIDYEAYLARFQNPQGGR